MLDIPGTPFQSEWVFHRTQSWGWDRFGDQEDKAGESSSFLHAAQWHLGEASWHEQRQSTGCLEHYMHAALICWPHLVGECRVAVGKLPTGPAWRIYQQSLANLLQAAIRFERIDPRGRLQIGPDPTGLNVLITHHGFPWHPQQISRVLMANETATLGVDRYYQSSGLGTPLVAVHENRGREPLYPDRLFFPVTAVLRPANAIDPESSSTIHTGMASRDIVLEFHNPHRFDSIPVASSVVPMARDLTAPLVHLYRETPRRFTEGLLDPDDADVRPRLFLSEPYQSGKIPIVFIHGLWSDPITWINMVNDLRSQGDINRHYQFWYFRYPTGRGLLESAAELRESLERTQDRFDPSHEQLALRHVVLIGHSMGGIVAKLQVSDSHDILWRQAASRDLEAVRTTPEMRARLRRMFFFQASPLVSRVVSIGTPHHGSESTRRLAGRLASRLVRSSPSEEARYRQLMDQNRDIFAEFLWDSWPTSIDLLEPTNPLLQAFAKLPIAPHVRRHTVIGDRSMNLRGEPTDGVVSVSSARQWDVESEYLVSLRHKEIHQHWTTSRHIMHILRIHAQESWHVKLEVLE
jgi:pimeloyl-ACP methyl ester carboxylesterase